MGLLTAGYCPPTSYPSNYWVDDYWADYGVPTVTVWVGSTPAVSDPLTSDRWFE